MVSFSRTKDLWDYQQEALQNALKALWLYYESERDYTTGETSEVVSARKASLMQWYRDNDIAAGLTLAPGGNRQVQRLLEEYYPLQDGGVDYEHFINRIGFWMATGSGKTIVIVKLVEVLATLIRRAEIPGHDILILSHRDDLLDQIREQVADFNMLRGDLYIHLHELRELPEVKRRSPGLFSDREIHVYYYRSDNLSDEQKEKIIDYRNYENGGRWYVLLDEAHKGDRDDSKRQHIYSILSRNGFLFNFSATFTDIRDKRTTAYDFNLARFIESGYGKHIALLKQENRAFRDKEDFTNEEKQKIVIKALLMLAYARQVGEEVAEIAGDVLPYHRPLLLTLVNSVNTDDADLKLFFRQLEAVGQGKLSSSVWKAAQRELWDELKDHPELMFEMRELVINQERFDGLSPGKVLELVFNATAPGAIEVLVRPSDRQEVAFRLKSSETPFALIRIGDISNWVSTELAGYEIVQGFEDESYFERLNDDRSPINMLLGSRSFYEGWDSNRPNIITFVNIGTGMDAQKFILQSVGRGSRIQPKAGFRQRLQALYNAREVDADLYRRLQDLVATLETLVLFGTKHEALQVVIEALQAESQQPKSTEIELSLNVSAIAGQPLLIPVYKASGRNLFELQEQGRFPIVPDEMDLLQRYVEYLDDPRLLIARHRLSPNQVQTLTQALEQRTEHFNTSAQTRRTGSLDVLMPRLARHFSLVPEEFEQLKPLDDEISHYKHVRVFLEDVSELNEKIAKVAGFQDPVASETALEARFKASEITLEEYTAGVKEAARAKAEEKFYHPQAVIDIRHIANHYYVPILLSSAERVTFIQRIIRHPSEVHFINSLEKHLEVPDNVFASYDWWMFSRIDEVSDTIYLPYYNSNKHSLSKFFPDFIFWLKKDLDYSIVFVDPKGTSIADYQHKVDGHRQLFGDNDSPRKFSSGSLEVTIRTYLYTPGDANSVAEGYRDFWFDADRLDRVFGRND